MARKAIGERGSWFAKVGDQRLPCVHKQWCGPPLKGAGIPYHDPVVRSGDRRTDELVQGLRESGRAILTDSKAPHGAHVRAERSGYIAVFSVTGVKIGDDGLHLWLSERLEELR